MKEKTGLGAKTGYKKGRQRKTACQERASDGSDVGLGLPETGHAVAGFPLAALLEQVDALEALEDVAFHDETGGALEAFVLRHGF
jgi:hypothetical protein